MPTELDPLTPVAFSPRRLSGARASRRQAAGGNAPRPPRGRRRPADGPWCSSAASISTWTTSASGANSRQLNPVCCSPSRVPTATTRSACWRSTLRPPHPPRVGPSEVQGLVAGHAIGCVPRRREWNAQAGKALDRRPRRDAAQPPAERRTGRREVSRRRTASSIGASVRLDQIDFLVDTCRRPLDHRLPPAHRGRTR